MNLDFIVREHLVVRSLPLDFVFLNSSGDPLADFATTIQLIVQTSEIHALVSLRNMLFEVIGNFFGDISADVFMFVKILDDLTVGRVWTKAMRFETG